MDSTNRRIKYLREKLGATLREISEDEQVPISYETVRKRLGDINIDTRKARLMKRVKKLNGGMDRVRKWEKGMAVDSPYCPVDEKDYLKNVARNHRSARAIANTWDVSITFVYHLYALQRINLTKFMDQMPEKSIEQFCEETGIGTRGSYE